MSGGGTTQTRFYQFGPDPAFSTLPAAFQACINAPSASCDSAVGSADAHSGFCSGPYAQSTYCACVNNVIPCPMKAAAACANAEFAYLPTAMMPGGRENAECASAQICVNSIEVGGSQNVVWDATQECGNTQVLNHFLTSNPTYSVLVFVLLLAMLVVAILPAPRPRAGRAAPPLRTGAGRAV